MMKKIVLPLVFMLTISCSGGGLVGYPAPMTATRVINNPPFVQAIEQGDLVAVEQLMPSISDVNARFYVASAKANFTPLQLAAAYGHRLLVIFFLDRGAAQAIDKGTEGGGRTALHLAVGRNHSQTAEVLLERGAHINAQIERGADAGKTPLHLAAEKNKPYMVQLLLNSGADANIETSAGKTPLHVAAEKNLVAIAEKLVALVAKDTAIDAKTSEGKTPLHLAAENNSREVVLYLLSNKADPQATDHQGRTPLALARSAHHKEIVKMLRRLEKKSCRRSCIDLAEECDEHCPRGPIIEIHGCKIDCGCLQNPCSFICKTLCCIWCYPLQEEVRGPQGEARRPTPSSSSSAASNPMEQPLLR